MIDDLFFLHGVKQKIPRLKVWDFYKIGLYH